MRSAKQTVRDAKRDVRSSEKEFKAAAEVQQNLDAAREAAEAAENKAVETAEQVERVLNE